MGIVIAPSKSFFVTFTEATKLYRFIVIVTEAQKIVTVTLSVTDGKLIVKPSLLYRNCTKFVLLFLVTTVAEKIRIFPSGKICFAK
jgi:hypothetical protein